jgi:hypothetical protein
MKGSHIQGFLRRIALPPAGQIRHIRIDCDDWNRLEVHLTAAAAFCRVPDLSQIKDFASAFSRLQNIQLDTSILHYIDETLQDAVNGRHLRDVPLSNFWRAQLPDFETAGMADFIQNQRLVAGCTPPCCRSCAAQDSNYKDQPIKTGLRFLRTNCAPAANAHLGKSKEWRQRQNDCSEDHQLKLECPLAIDYRSSKWLNLDCKDSEVYIHVMGPENAMRIQGVQKGTKYMKRKEFKIFQCRLPRPACSFLELKHGVERIICEYLLDVGMIDAIPDDVMEEKTPQLPEN